MWQDFLAEEPGLLPLGVAQVHLQRATEALAEQIEKALTLCLDRIIFDLQQKRFDAIAIERQILHNQRQ